MKPSYKILIILAVVLLFMYSVYVALTQKSDNLSAPSQTSSHLKNIPVNSGSVGVKDFTKTPVEIHGDNTVISNSGGYIISYYDSDHSFVITILAQPVAQNRQLAERVFLDQLQIKAEDACKLAVSLTVPAAVDSSLAGRDFGLSFCPNGQSF